MEFFTGDDGIRRRRVVDGLGKAHTYKLCTGQNNACENDAKADDLCTGCKTGVYKLPTEARAEGEKFEENGERFIFTGGQRKKLCKGKGNTCEKLVRKEGHCAGCSSGREKAPIEGLKIGDVVDRADGKFKFDGKQLRRLCADGCGKFAVKEGKCNLHANGGVRKAKEPKA